MHIIQDKRSLIRENKEYQKAKSWLRWKAELAMEKGY